MTSIVLTMVGAASTGTSGICSTHRNSQQFATRMLPTIERDLMRLAGIHIDIAASIETVQKILHTLETARPVLFVEYLTLEPVTEAARRSTSDVATVRAGIHVYGALPRRKD